jgi:hypothetical protein
MMFIVGIGLTGPFAYHESSRRVALAGVPVDSRLVIWILLVLLVVIGGGAAIGIAMKSNRQLSGGGQKALPVGSGDKLLERTVRDLRVDDVLTIDGADYLCEGMIAYDEDGHRWTAGRVVDGATVKWLVVGLDRASSSSMRLLAVDNSTPLSGYPPEALVIDDIRYVLDKRGAATCALYGDVGGLGALKKGRPEGHVERCRWWLYNATGEDTLIVEQWGSDYRVLRGKRVGDGTVELIPGS